MTEKKTYDDTLKQMFEDIYGKLPADFYENPEIKNRTTMTVTVPVLVKDSLEHGLNAMKGDFEITLGEYAGLLLSGVLIRERTMGSNAND